MVFEGIFTWFMLTSCRVLGIGPVPMAGLLGLVTGVLAFIPNIGAITSGILMVAVGFSAGHAPGRLVRSSSISSSRTSTAIWSCPYVARRTVDLAPAVVLAMQLLMGALFGILGVLFADPILATLKVVLVDLSQRQAREEDEGPEVVAGRRPDYCCGCAPPPPACIIAAALGTTFTTFTSKSRSALGGIGPSGGTLAP